MAYAEVENRKVMLIVKPAITPSCVSHAGRAKKKFDFVFCIAHGLRRIGKD